VIELTEKPSQRGSTAG